MRKGKARNAWAHTALIPAAVLCILAASIAFADGETRLATKAEKDFTKSVLTAFSRAVPPGPQGWDMTLDTTVIKDLERVTTGVEEYPLQVEYCAAWQDTKKLNEARVKLDEELMKLAQGPPEKITDEAVEEISRRTAARDAKVRIDLKANILSEGIYEQIAPASSIAGGLVYRSPGEYRSNTGWHEGCTYVFLGKNWKLSRSGGTYVNYTPNKRIPHTAVQSIVVKVRADPSRARQILNGIDWVALKKLIKN
ncbi:MAG: hypothetical protein ACM3X6_14855 [Patescibacteria group bacterium]